MKLFAILLMIAAPAFAASRNNQERVENLLKRMTLDEKLGQLQQSGGPVEGSLDLVDQAGKGRLSSTLNVRGAKAINQIQRAAVEKSRLKIPLIFAFDVIHGYRTIFPIPLAMASSWDPAVVESASTLAAREAWMDGLRWTFSPMLDIARDPRWGRVAEGNGEDPYLGSAMARAYVRGYQGDDASAVGRLAACAKHWVGYGAAEAGRDYSTTEISERTLREIYFPPFRAAVDAGVWTFMSAFNDLDGVPASANHWTLTDILRHDMGFKGFVVSDWDSVLQLIAHGLAANEADAAKRALSAGVDMEMNSTTYMKELPSLIKAGKIPMAVVDEAVRRVLNAKFALGLFEHPYADESKKAGAPDEESRTVARRAAERSLVLLKNDNGVLPFFPGIKKLAVLGDLADDGAAVLGSWSGDGRPEEAVTILAGIRDAVPETQVVFSSETVIKDADAYVLVLGEKGDMSGEASSRAYLGLRGEDLALARGALITGKPVVAVLLNGRPLTLTGIVDEVPAIIEAWQPGTEGGHAVASALFGKINPGGKLPISFPRTVGQVPLYYNHKSTGRPAEDENHFTSKYLDAPVTPQFPFGWGLSYTKFSLSDLRLSAPKIARGGSVTVKASVSNDGAMAGDEVVQLYIKRRGVSVTRPVRELKGFSRVALPQGAKKEVAFTLGPKELGFFGLDMRYSVEPGPVEVFVGTSSVGGLSASFTIGE